MTNLEFEQLKSKDESATAKEIQLWQCFFENKDKLSFVKRAAHQS